jgi:S-adenosylhomocysteine hydrolase
MTADSPVDAVRGKGLVVGASGNRSIDSTVIAALSHNTYVVSASSEQYEIDVEELEQQQKRRVPLVDDTGRPVGTSYSLPSGNRTIHLVANGYPVNFWGSESMPEQAADLIMSLILLSLVEVAQGSYAKPGLDSDAVNEIADKYKLAEKFLEFHNAR